MLQVDFDKYLCTTQWVAESKLQTVSEPRSVDCRGGSETCFTVDRKREEFPCRRESIPEINQMVTACPLDCRGSKALSVTVKQPYTDYNCAKYYTYGQFETEDDWYMWVVEPCAVKLTIWCRFFTDERKRQGKV